MPQKEWNTQVAGRDIRVVNTWTGGTRLYIDGECRDRNSTFFSLTWTPWLSARLVQDDPTSDLIEVKVVAIFNVKAQILVNGQFVAGDRS